MTIRELLRSSWPPSAKQADPKARPGRSRLSLLSLGLSVGLALSAATAPQALHADEALEVAKKRYEAGERDFIAGRYWQAAKSFEEAYGLSRRGDLLFNAARAYDRGEYGVRAIEAYQAYIDAVPDATDKVQIQKRIVELQGTLAKLMIVTNDQGFLFIDGHEYGRTPMQQPMDIDSGYHRVEVRKDNRSWSKESQFSAGQSYKFDAELSGSAPNGQGLSDVASGEERRPKQRVRKLALSAGLGGAFDVVGNSFAPHQAAINLGVDYRLVDHTFFGFDFVLRLPIEVAQGWRNAGFLIGGRGAWSPVPRLPLELTAEVDLGLGVLDYSSSAPFSARTACARPSGLSSCTLYGLRLHPKLGVAYRVVPAFEVRGELFGVEVDFTNPIADPRITVGVAAAYRFF